MNVLVTGGGGFAGKYISEYFSENGNNVTATYRSNKPYDEGKNIKYVQQELSDEINIDGDFDAIIHTACSASRKDLPIKEYIRDNVDSARRLVEFANKKKIKVIIYFSTRSIYGEIRGKEVNEENDIINSDKYGLTKYLAECVFRDANNIDTIGLRTPGIIGPNAHDIWLVDIVNKIINGEKVQVTDFETKNLVWIEDIAKFINRLIEDAIKGKKFKYSVVNLACSESVNNLEIVDVIKKRFGSMSEIIINKKNSYLFVLNSSRAQEMGFVSLKPLEIIDRYLNTLNVK